MTRTMGPKCRIPKRVIEKMSGILEHTQSTPSHSSVLGLPPGLAKVLLPGLPLTRQQLFPAHDPLEVVVNLPFVRLGGGKGCAGPDTYEGCFFLKKFFVRHLEQYHAHLV